MSPFVMDNEAKRGLREYYTQKILDWIEEEEINKEEEQIA